MHTLRAGSLIILCCVLVIPQTARAQPTIKISSLPFNEMIKELSSPEILVRFMRKNFTFIDDRRLFGTEDYWQSPEELWSRREGDCEDYALFAKEALEKQGMTAYVVSFYGNNGYAHTVTIFEENGRYDVINEDRLFKYRTKTIEEALSRVYPDWSWGAFAEQRGTRGWAIQKINRTESNS